VRAPSSACLAALLIALGLSLATPAFAANKGFYLNFENAELTSVVKAMGELTGKTFVIDPRVKGTLTIASPRPVSAAIAYEIFLAALRMQGFSAVQADGVVRIVPEADAKFYAGDALGKVRKGKIGGEMATRLFKLRHESAAQLLPVLRPLVGANSSIGADAGSNTLLVTDYADNVDRLARIIENLDVPSADEPVLISLRHAAAPEVAGLLARMFGPVAGGAPGQDSLDRLDIAVDVRTNSLIVRGRDRSQVSKVQNLVASLDVPTPVAGNVHVIYLKNAEAVQVAKTLRSILSGDASNLAQAGQPLSPGLANAPRPGSAAIQPEAGPGMVQADPASNALIVTASEAVFGNIKAVVEKLDVRRAQVLVEALIAEVSAEKAAEFGIQWFNLNGASATTTGNRFFGGFGSSTGNNIASVAANPASAAKGLSLGLVQGQIKLPSAGGEVNILNLGMLARALETEANANILSTPTLLTLDNEEAKISVGTNVPFLTGQYSLSTSGGTANPFQTIERKDVGLTLKVKPQISEGGTVRMQIYQEVSKLRKTPSEIQLTDVATDKRSIESTVLVDDGQIVVLGGLIEDQIQDVEDRVPLLGDIPVLGHLFRYTTRSHAKTNLMVFLRPQVIRDAAAAAAATHPRYDYILGRQKELAPPHKLLLPDVEAPMLRYEFNLGAGQ